MINLYKFHWDVGRMGQVEGLFIAESKDIDDLIGKEIYFGEILGKHSEVYGELRKEDIEIITSDQDVIESLGDSFGSKTISGYNPLDYYEEEEV